MNSNLIILLAALCFSAAGQTSEEERNKAIALAVFQSFNAHDWENPTDNYDRFSQCQASQIANYLKLCLGQMDSRGWKKISLIH